MRSKISVAWLLHPFSVFFLSKFYRCVSKLVWHCCMRKDFCIGKKLSFFGGRMLMCKNQCCGVASAFSAFSHLFEGKTEPWKSVFFILTFLHLKTLFGVSGSTPTSPKCPLLIDLSPLKDTFGR